jgi:acyl-CoA synthetase (AMP-forming)/AMP-acid ligase II
VVLDHLFASDVLQAIDQQRVTGLTAVPPLYLQLLQALQPSQRERTAEACGASLRYSPIPAATCRARPGRHCGSTGHRPSRCPCTGSPEASRASRLPPADFDRKPDSIGIAVPGGTRLHVLRADGTPCAADEPGELVQQGPLVARGYWNDPALAVTRFQGRARRRTGGVVGRQRTSAMLTATCGSSAAATSRSRPRATASARPRSSPPAAAGCAQRVAVGVPATTVWDRPSRRSSLQPPASSRQALLTGLRATLPGWMVPRRVEVWPGVLPRNANGKFDRVQIRRHTLQQHASRTPARWTEGDD